MDSTANSNIVTKKNILFTLLYLTGLFGCFATIKIGAVSSSTYVFPFLYLYSLFAVSSKLTNKDFNSLVKVVVLTFTGITISSFFSYNPLDSVKSITYLLFNFLFGYWLSKYYNKEQFLFLTLMVLTIIMLISTLLLLIYPEIVIYDDPLDRKSILGLPNFKGLFPHKIHAGIFNCLGFMISMYFYKSINKKKYLMLSFLFLIGVICSGSSLALTSFVISIASYFVIKNSKQLLGLSGLGFFSLLLLVALYAGYELQVHESLLESIGRDASLTGRVDIWEFGINYIKSNPLLGGGFEVFFEESPLSPANELWNRSSYYDAPSFHNGYFEILAEAGVIGAFSFLLLIIRNFYYSLKTNDLIVVTIMVLVFVLNTGAAMLIQPNNFFFTFLSYYFFNINNNITWKRQSVLK